MDGVDTQPKLPELPAMTTPAIAGSTAVYNPQEYERSGYQPGIGTRHLRRLLGYFAGGGLALVLLVLIGEKVLLPEMRPSALLASFESSLELGVMKGKLPKGSDGKEIATQADYEREIAKARAAGQADAQYQYQEKIAALQANQQRIIQAYGALYQRTNMIAQAGLQMESALQQARQQMVASSQGGRQVVSMWGDIGCALGMQSGCDAAQNARDSMVSDMNAAQVDVGARINQLMGEVPDPAALVANSDMAANGTPRLRQH